MTQRQAETDLDGEPRAGFWEILTTWGPPILAVILIRLFVFEPYRIPSGSMVPTLRVGDHVFVTKFAYGVWMPWKNIGIPFTEIGLPFDNVELFDTADPQRGDVVVFHWPRNEAITYIKRVVGLPGERIEVVDNQIFVNGEAVPRKQLGDFEDVSNQCRPRKARHWVETFPGVDGGEPTRHGVLTNRGYGGPLANHEEVVVPPDHVFVMGDNRDHSEDSRAWGFVREEQIKGKAHFVWLSWDPCSTFPGSIRLDRMFRSLYEEPTAQDDGAVPAG